ncbi:hypothetical protein [Streptomyces sp. NRRL B-1347]|uniref:hypothetical protein n=1 Tax=Streptomyces sp. NRRL B-1347 TaxID=1476877 RepID=UPI00068DFBB5|nr:hypothetical protein [Streptomyces sp. NRRL B-1347]
MEAAALAATAVGVLAGALTGVATGVGEGAGTAAVELVRARLAVSARGRAALEGLDADATDPAARAETQNVLAEEIEADPELRRQLTASLSSATSTTHLTGSVVIKGSRVSRSHIAIGPLTVNNTPGGRAALTIGLVVLLAVLSLGAYGGVQLLAPDGTGYTSVPMDAENLGDERTAYERRPGGTLLREKRAIVFVRVGKVVLTILYSGVPKDSAFPPDLQELTRLAVRNAQRQAGGH